MKPNHEPKLDNESIPHAKQPHSFLRPRYERVVELRVVTKRHPAASGTIADPGKGGLRLVVGGRFLVQGAGFWDMGLGSCGVEGLCKEFRQHFSSGSVKTSEH